MAGAAIFDVTMDQGVTYELVGYVQIPANPDLPHDSITNPYIPFDFTGWTALSKIRDLYESSTADLTSTDIDRIALNKKRGTTAAGYFTITIAPADTTNWGFSKDSPDIYTGVWDITMSKLGLTIKPYVGEWKINRLVSR